MTTSFLNAETLRRSLYAQFKCVFWLITIFVVLAAGPAIVLTEQSTGSGGAINVSGSLRMMSYKLTVAVSNPYATYQALKSSKAPTNYFTPNILRKSWSRLVVSVVHLDALAFPVAAT